VKAWRRVKLEKPAYTALVKPKRDFRDRRVETGDGVMGGVRRIESYVF